MSITPAQAEALARIVAEFDRADEHELARWGRRLPPKYGVPVLTGERSPSPAWVARDVRTLRSLHDAGLIDLTASVMHSTKLLLGAFGRWAGGSKRRPYVALTARPTPAGRAYLARVGA